MEKSSGKIYRPKPANFEEHVDRAFHAHLQRKANEVIAAKRGVTEKTIRNWKTVGLPKSAKRAIAMIEEDPDLFEAVFGQRGQL